MFIPLLHLGHMWAAFRQRDLIPQSSRSPMELVSMGIPKVLRGDSISDMAVLSMHHPALQEGETDQEEGDWKVSPLTVISSVVFLQKTGTEGV